MTQAFPEGVPSERDYKALLASEDFKTMEEFSDRFLSANKATLRNYAKKWVDDSFHHWSRQWEYPFVYDKVQQLAQHEPKPKILDAGSGVTFFPYYLNSQFKEAQIYCCDYDTKLKSIFDRLNAEAEKTVAFSQADLKDLPYENESFYLVYCVSVLEHTANYEEIIDEFHRVLQLNGTLVVTFDISLDGTRDIAADKAEALLTAFAKRFDSNKNFPRELDSQLSMPGIFTTLTARDINPALLPWKKAAFLHRIKSFINTGRFGSWPPSLTVFCLGLTKRAL